MHDRDADILRFLDDAGWPAVELTRLAGDASSRRYLRVVRNCRSAILMDAPRDTCGSQWGFATLNEKLRCAGLSAPEVLAQDIDNGFVLLEDLGSETFSDVLARDRTMERQLYEAATDFVLATQDRLNIDALPTYGPAEMARAVRPAWSYYLNQTHDPSSDWIELERSLKTALSRVDAGPVFVHRDFHADNLIWLPQRDGVARIGVLDFQDAVAGHPIYDLASLIQDARRDVDEDCRVGAIDRYSASTGRDRDWIDAALAVQATQRHLRILGIFARLAVERGKPAYRTLLPKVWADLRSNLDHPVLSELRPMIDALIPPPEQGI